MSVKQLKLSDDVVRILERSEITENSLTISEQLERAMYVKVNKAIVAAGGKWNRKEGKHIFGRDPREVLGLAIETGGIVDHKKTFCQFFTPEDVAFEMASFLMAYPPDRVLEPSAGDGALVKKVLFPGMVHNGLDITCVECDADLCDKLSELPVNVLCGDFLLMDDLGTFDRIIMNPPYDRGLDIKHILHARTMLEPGGRLVALCGNGPRQQEVLMPMADDWKELDPGSFKESGTMVNVAMLVIEG